MMADMTEANESERVLRARGWRRTPKGWRHHALYYPWPEADATKLLGEVDAGEEKGAAFASLKP